MNIPPPLLALFALASSLAAETLPTWSDKAAVDWWKAKAGSDWTVEAKHLAENLRTMQQAGGADKATTSAHWLGWLELAVWLDAAHGAAPSAYFGSEEGKAALATLGSDAPARRAFLTQLSAFDNASAALEIYCRIYQAHPAAFKKLPQLAVAFALVWDQPFPDQWPHLWTKKANCAIGDSDPAARFAAYVRSWDAKKFLLDPSRLNARELMFVVDSPLELKELGYAQQVQLQDPKRLNDLFAAVPYDLARMQKGELHWPHGQYRLIDVGKKGGICADQAFFVAQTGKAFCIPTVLLLGQGTSGGHAWVGYVGEAGRWSLEVGRYRQENYVAGSAWDPQTWRRVTDAQLRFLFKEPSTGANILKSRLLCRWALMNQDSADYVRLLSLAKSSWPRSFDVWDLLAECAESATLSFEQKQSFWNNWITTFKDDRDMRVKAQSRLLKLYESQGDTKAAEQLRAVITNENKTGRFDLAIRLAAEPVLELANAGKWPEAQAALEKALDQFKKNAGGDLFYNLVQPFIEQALQAGKSDIATAIWQKARPLFQIKAPASTLEVDLKNLAQLLGLPWP